MDSSSCSGRSVTRSGGGLKGRFDVSGLRIVQEKMRQAKETKERERVGGRGESQWNRGGVLEGHLEWLFLQFCRPRIGRKKKKIEEMLVQSASRLSGNEVLQYKC